MRRKHVLVGVGSLLLVTLGWSWLPRAPALSDQQFGQWIEECSEVGQSFISDNLVSNETAYADHLDFLSRTVPKGSVYVGVGPEQNFSYMASLQPCYAFIVDIRRGNLLQHLWFKFLFEECPTPQQWLASLLSRRCDDKWLNMTYPEWLEALSHSHSQPQLAAELRGRFQRWLSTMNVAIRRGDWKFLEKIQQEFIHNGLDIRFVYRISPPGQPIFPTFREVLLSQDSHGHFGNFLATAQGYGWVRRMQQENRVIPVVGDFAGHHAFSEISCILHRQHLKVGLFYASNVEFYLMPRQLPGEKMENFVFNLESLPAGANSLLLKTHLSDMKEAIHYPRGNPMFVPRIQRLQQFVNDYLQGDIPSYSACMLKNDLSRSAEALP